PEVPLLDEGSLEVVEVDREGFEPVGVGPVPGVDRVVGRQSVGESVTLDEEHVAPVAEEGTGGQSQQESQERKVEKDVSGLTQVAALPGNGVAVPFDPVPLRSEERRVGKGARPAWRAAGVET